MNKQELISKLEAFAPRETQEPWDCSGWIVEHNNSEINRVMYALTITESVYSQAKENKCDLIISHHPMFSVPLKYKDVQMYCAHTNLDKANGGTTDTIIEKLGFEVTEKENDFVRIVEFESPVLLTDLISKLKSVFPKLRHVNNKSVKEVKVLGFCAGSGSEFLEETRADCFITGDLKYHTVCETDKVVIDIGHFESEVLIKEKLEEITGIKGVMADEKSPFI